jgi:hypothetical protein
MSHYAKVATAFSDRECLFLALEKLFGRGKTEIYNGGNGIVHGYRGQQQRAEIIVRRDVCGGYGDLGFAKNKSGKYEMIKDDMLHFPIQKLTRLYIEQYVSRRTRGKFRVIKSEDDRIELQAIM